MIESYGSWLWELASHDGEIKRSKLRQRLGMKLSELYPILQELEKEGKIGISELNDRRSGQWIILKSSYFHKAEKINF